MKAYALTPRQAEVLEGVRKGKSNKEIARSLGISDATVKLHVSNIFNALGVYSRVKLIALSGAENVERFDMTDAEILEEFGKAFYSLSDKTLDERIVKFARCVIRRTKGEMK